MNINFLVVLERVREQLKKRGAAGIKGLARNFKALDSYDGNRKVDRQEFSVGMRENQIQLNPAEEQVSILFLLPNIFSNFLRLSSITSIETEMVSLTSMSSSLESE